MTRTTGLGDEEWARHVARLEVYLELSRRQAGRCGLCARFLPVGAGDPHHKRRKSQGGSREELEGAEGNLDHLVLLHRECHDWVHRNPAKARQAGLLIFTEDTTT